MVKRGAESRVLFQHFGEGHGVYDWLFLIGFLALAWLLVTPILLVLHLKLKRRLDELAARVKSLEAAPSVVSSTARVPEPKPAEAPTMPVVSDPLAETPADNMVAPPPAPAPVEETSPAKEAAPVAAASQVPDQATTAETPPSAFVFRQDRIDAFVAWLKENWVLAAGAVSLSLAGVFLVQYGAERGYLTPFWRVMAAFAFGILLMIGGEYLRRRFGDDDKDSATQFLPSALSGAGLLTLFAAVLSARVLYDLIGPGAAFAGLALVSTAGVIFGWFYGPVLTVVGILGATSAPYLIGGSSDETWLMQYYFALIALTALAIDTMKRWAWVSVLALLATGGSMWFVFLGAGYPEHFMAGLLILTIGAIVIPQRALVPNHSGAPLLAIFWGGRAEFPTRVSFAVTANLAAAAFAVSLIGTQIADAYLALLVLVAMLLATTLWMWRAPALADHPILPVVSFLGVVISQALVSGPLHETMLNAVSRPPETAPPATLWHLMAVAIIGTFLTFWRMPRAATPLLWALAAASLAPVTVFLLEFLWDPGRVYGAPLWSLTVIGTAAVMTLLAERAIRLKVPDARLITSLFAVAALSLIGLSLFLVLTKTALTLGLATMILLVVLLDRRFELPVLAYYAALGAAVITYRLIIDPGLDWAMGHNTSLLQVVLAYVGTGAVLGVAWGVVRTRHARLGSILESTVWILAAALVLVLFERLLPRSSFESHWGLGLLAALWATMALAQIHRMKGAARFERYLRIALAGVLTLLAVVILSVRFAFFSPLDGDLVLGLPFFSSLALAYLPLAIVLGLGAWKIAMPKALRITLALLSVGYLFAYLALSIRHLWRGPDLSVAGVSDPELYTYTLAMLLISAGTLLVAFWKRADWLRKVAMVGIGLTIAKVFVVDMAGLSGLMRVLSFMGLGLALLALTWLDRVTSARWGEGKISVEDRVD